MEKLFEMHVLDTLGNFLPLCIIEPVQCAYKDSPLRDGYVQNVLRHLHGH